MVGKEVRRISRGYHYFFVKPRRGGNAHEVAGKLMEIKNVKEVSIVDGDYGFIVKAREADENDGQVMVSINKAVGGRTSKAVCHCQYLRQ